MFFKEPNCRLSIFSLTYSSSQSVTKRSQVLDSVDVSEMGRRSLVMSWGDDIFGIGMTLAFFQMAGTVACWTEALKIDATGEHW